MLGLVNVVNANGDGGYWAIPEYLVPFALETLGPGARVEEPNIDGALLLRLAEGRAMEQLIMDGTG